jgi:putative hydrolase of the HAD superfamily
VAGAVLPQLFSCDLGEVKPSPTVFVRALEHLGAPPEGVCFVDDRPANVEAARQLGITAVQFDGPAQLHRLVEATLAGAGVGAEAGTAEIGHAPQP